MRDTYVGWNGDPSIECPWFRIADVSSCIIYQKNRITFAQIQDILITYKNVKNNKHPRWLIETHDNLKYIDNKYAKELKEQLPDYVILLNTNTYVVRYCDKIYLNVCAILR